MTEMYRRRWQPDIGMIADQLMEDVSSETAEYQGVTDVLATLQSWKQTAADHGEDLTENDLVLIVLELAYRAAGQVGIGWKDGQR